MGVVYSVPGLSESTLEDTSSYPTVRWLSVPTAITGNFGVIRLAPDGTSPGPPDGIPLVPGGLFPVYSLGPTRQLGQQLAGDGLTVVDWPWDWRMSMLAAGDALATDVRTRVTSSDPCAMVSHSAGGLVARRAWWSLAASGQSGLVRRIVTLGTPHWGSYTAALGFSGVSSLIDYLVGLNRIVGGQIFGVTRFPAYRTWTSRQVADLLLTFPSFYEILPSLGEPNWQVNDPNRIDLYTGANWGGGVLPQQAWLDHARTTYTSWLTDPNSLPPDDVLTTVAGTGYPTATTLGFVERLGEGTAYRDGPGDGTVTIASALVSQSERVQVQGEHSNLLADQVGNGNVRRWILDVRAPTPIPPPVEVETAVQVPRLPQFPGVINTGEAVSQSGELRPAGLCGPGH